MSTFGRWLELELRRHDMTQVQLAQRMNVGTTTVSQWVRGKRRPTVESCYALADVLRLAPAVVMDRAGYPTEDLTDAEQEREEHILALWRRLSEDAKQDVAEFIEFRRAKEQV